MVHTILELPGSKKILNIQEKNRLQQQNSVQSGIYPVRNAQSGEPENPPKNVIFLFVHLCKKRLCNLREE